MESLILAQTNAGGVLNTCSVSSEIPGGERVSNTWVICPALRDKPGKLGLLPDRTTGCMFCGGKRFLAVWMSLRGLSACWWGDGLPRRTTVKPA